MQNTSGSPSIDGQIPAIFPLPQFLAARPFRAPKSHRDRAVTLVTPHEASCCHRGPPFEVQKTYRLVPFDHNPKHPRGTWDGAPDPASGLWEDQTAIRLGAHCSQEVWLDDLRDWVELFDLLSGKPDAAIALGALRREARREFSQRRWLIPDKRGRYEDCPSRWLVLDLDHVPGDPDDAKDAITDYLSKIAPELEACAYVACFTGSAGIKGTRVRLVFELAESRTLAAMRGFALTVNMRANRDVIDARIYTPGHLVFTAAPHLYGHVASGNGEIAQVLPRPVPSRAWLAQFNGDKAEIPSAGPVTTVTGADLVTSDQQSEQLGKAAAAELLQALGTGNYADNIHRWLCSIAWASPPHRLESDFRTAVATIQQRIQETSEQARLDERMREHGCEKKLRRAWAAALTRKAAQTAQLLTIGSTPQVLSTKAGPASLADLSVNTKDAPTTPAIPATVADVRAQLAADVVREGNAILAGGKRHVLFTHAPGAGKTTAVRALLTAGTLASKLTRIRVPTHKLAVELVTDLKTHALALAPNGNHFGQDLVAAIRHHKGRSQPGMCPDADSKPKADLAERLGVSVKKNVCAGCKTGKAGQCPWLRQEEDETSGVIVEAHHVAHAPGKRRADLVINDEGVIGATLRGGSAAFAIADLDQTATIFAVRTGHQLGKALRGSTMELNAYRSELVVALRRGLPAKIGAAGVLSTAMLPSLIAQTTFEKRLRVRSESTTGCGADHAAELERQLQATLFARIANDKTAVLDRNAAESQLRASQLASRLYGAIAASAARSYVFGVAVFAQPTNKGQVASFKCVVRSPEVDCEASISFDGTADADVWRAIASPAGSAFDEAIFGADLPVAADAVSCIRYADKAGARSALIPNLEPTQDELDAARQRDWLLNLPMWAVNAGAIENPAAQLAAAQANVQAHQSKRARRKKRADSHLDLLWRFVVHEALTHNARAATVDGKKVSVLLVAQKAVLSHLAALQLPPTVAATHFGALRGLNAYKDVPCCIVIGRPRPADIDLELMTEALHSYNPAVAEIARQRPGQWSEENPDPRVAAVQRVIAAAEVKQAVARIRPFDRTPANPCAVHVFGVYDPGFPADLVEARLWSDADRTPCEIALAAGAVFSDPVLNQRAYPGLFPKGNGKGRGRLDMDQRRDFARLLSGLGTEAEKLSLYPYSEIGRGRDGISISARETVSEPRGTKPKFKLMKLRVGATRGPAVRAIVDASWTCAQVEQRLGCAVTAWQEVAPSGALPEPARAKPPAAFAAYSADALSAALH